MVLIKCVLKDVYDCEIKEELDDLYVAKVWSDISKRSTKRESKK